MSNALTTSSHATKRTPNTTGGQRRSDRRRRRVIGRHRGDARLDRRSSGTCFEPAQRLAHLGDFLKNSVSSRVSSVRSPRSTSTMPVIRPGRGDITTTRSDR